MKFANLVWPVTKKDKESTEDKLKNFTSQMLLQPVEFLKIQMDVKMGWVLTEVQVSG